MNLIRLIRDLIAAMNAQTAALNRATEDAAWVRFQEQRHVLALTHHHGHSHGHAGGNASLMGGCAD